MNIDERGLRIAKLIPPDLQMLELTAHEDLSTATLVLELAETDSDALIASISASAESIDEADARLRRLLGDPDAR